MVFFSRQLCESQNAKKRLTKFVGGRFSLFCRSVFISQIAGEEKVSYDRSKATSSIMANREIGYQSTRGTKGGRAAVEII